MRIDPIRKPDDVIDRLPRTCDYCLTSDNIDVVHYTRTTGIYACPKHKDEAEMDLLTQTRNEMRRNVTVERLMELGIPLMLLGARIWVTDLPPFGPVARFKYYPDPSPGHWGMGIQRVSDGKEKIVRVDQFVDTHPSFSNLLALLNTATTTQRVIL